MGNQQSSPASTATRLAGFKHQHTHDPAAAASESPRRMRRNETRVMELQSEIEAAKVLKVNHDKDHHECMDAVANDNLEQCDARKAQYDAEVDAQRHRNAQSRATNAQKISELSAANQNQLTVTRDMNTAEMDAACRENSTRKADHEAWMAQLRQQNEQKMATLASDGEDNLNAMKCRHRVSVLSHRKEFAELEATNQASMDAIEQQHQVELAQTQRNREDVRVRHQGKIAAMGIRHQHETNNIELRQRHEVDELGRTNDAKHATQKEDMRSQKARNQKKMNNMCRIMMETEELEAKLEASTLRYFELSQQVNRQRAEMQRYADLERETEEQLTVQMKHIDALQNNVAAGVSDAVRDVDEISSLEKLYPLLDAIIAAQESYRLRVTSEVAAIAEINGDLLTKHQ